MSGVRKLSQLVGSQFQKSKIITNSEQMQGDVYNIELTTSQAHAIMKILPKNYSMHVDRVLKTKKINKKSSFGDRRNNRNKKDYEEEVEVNQIVEQPVPEPIQTINYQEMIRRCQKILSLLKKNKNSWPFKQPVDPIAMGIPHYKDIITNPMDLRTMEQNLLSHKYLTLSQFYADIQLIINNSYTFNKSNAQFYAITSQFEKYFEKLKSEPIVTSNVVSPPPVTAPPVKKMSSQTSGATGVTKTKSQNKHGIQIAQRKEIALKLKQLPKQQLFHLISRINDNEKNNELNLETLPVEKLRILQEHLSKRQFTSSQPTRQKQQVKKPVEDDESSFQSDSDS